MPRTPVITQVEVAQSFVVPCINCHHDAVWLGQSSHGEHCPETGFLCDTCRTCLEGSYASAIRHGDKCANCHQTLSGHVEQHLAFVRLP